MKLYAPIKVGKPTAIVISDRDLSVGYNGLFRASFKEAMEIMPALSELFKSIPVDNIDDYEIDIKVHMLMKNQYPCIPNWHCDNVPRDFKTGHTDYPAAEQTILQNIDKPMFLWVSGTPCTEFLSRDIITHENITGHDSVASVMRDLMAADSVCDDKPVVERIKPQQWYQMNRLTPHRGTISESNQWRIFCRVTHKSCLPARNVESVVRRHSQVYLDSNLFTW